MNLWTWCLSFSGHPIRRPWCRYHHYGLMDSYFFQWVIVLLDHYLFWRSNWPRLGYWEFKLAPECFWPVLIIFKARVAFCHIKMFQAHLVLSLPQPFFQGTLVPFRGATRIWVANNQHLCLQFFVFFERFIYSKILFMTLLFYKCLAIWG